MEGDFTTNSSISQGSCTPYSDVTQTKKKSLTKVKRPMNAFIRFSQLKRHEIIEKEGPSNHAVLSKRLGEIWKKMSAEEKSPFYDESRRLKELHALEYPDYRYKPVKKTKKETLRRVSDRSKTINKRTARTLPTPYNFETIPTPSAIVPNTSTNTGSASVSYPDSPLSSSDCLELDQPYLPVKDSPGHYSFNVIKMSPGTSILTPAQTPSPSYIIEQRSESPENYTTMSQLPLPTLDSYRNSSEPLIFALRNEQDVVEMTPFEQQSSLKDLQLECKDIPVLQQECLYIPDQDLNVFAGIDNRELEEYLNGCDFDITPPVVANDLAVNFSLAHEYETSNEFRHSKKPFEESSVKDPLLSSASIF